jgi:hypothetical protein
MWPSLETASRVADWANVFFIGSLVVAVISTILIVWMANVKEAHWDELRRISEEKIAEANARQKEAELQILQLRFPRSLDIEKFKAAVEKMSPPTSFEVLYDANAPDASFLASLIWGTFFNAKWSTQQTRGQEPLKAPPPNILPYANMPWTQAAGGAPWGLSVVTNERADIDGDSTAAALVKALGASVKGPPSPTTLGYQTSMPVAPGAIRVIVGPKTP